MIFENEKDRGKERKLQAFLESKGYVVEPTSTLSAFDFKLYYRDRLHALVEYKCRSKLWNPLKIDKQKIRQLYYAAYELGCQPILIVCDDPYYFTRVRLNYKTSEFIRKKNAAFRQETPDKVYEIPKSDFKMM